MSPVSKPTDVRIILEIDGHNWHFTALVSPVGHSSRKKPLGYSLFLRDVTELEASRRRLRKQNERLDQVASTIGHDLRNPLTVADGYLQIAMDTGNDEPLNKIEDSIGRMDTIIEDVLTLVQGGQSIDKSKPTSLDAVAREAWEHVATETATLAIRTDEIVEADRSRLLQLFENLFRNAHEHGGDDVSVTVDVTEDRFYVQDDGPGIPADNRNKVLESGYTTNENAGFGLTIVSEIAQAYGWDVFVAEGPGGGTRFDIEVNDFPERA